MISDHQLALIKPYCRCRYHQYSWYDIRRYFANTKGCLHTNTLDRATMNKTIVYMIMNNIPGWGTRRPP